jgi:hypothetical protein
MTVRQKTEWLTPQTIMAVVSLLAAFGSFWLSFDRRVTTNETKIASLVEALRDHRSEEGTRLGRIEDKIDRLNEKGATR